MGGIRLLVSCYLLLAFSVSIVLCGDED